MYPQFVINTCTCINMPWYICICMLCCILYSPWYIYIYVTVHAKTYRKSAKNIFEIRADFASPIYILDFLQNSCG